MEKEINGEKMQRKKERGAKNGRKWRMENQREKEKKKRDYACKCLLTITPKNILSPTSPILKLLMIN